MIFGQNFLLNIILSLRIKAFNYLEEICLVEKDIDNNKHYEILLQDAVDQSENFDTIDELMNRYYSLKTTREVIFFISPFIN